MKYYVKYRFEYFYKDYYLNFNLKDSLQNCKANWSADAFIDYYPLFAVRKVMKNFKKQYNNYTILKIENE